MAKTRNRPKRRKARTRAFVTRMVLSRMNGSAYYRKKVEAAGGVEAFVDALLARPEEAA